MEGNKRVNNTAIKSVGSYIGMLGVTVEIFLTSLRDNTLLLLLLMVAV